VISPLLANLFLHYAFDAWMSRNYPHIPFERYADDAIWHCKSAEEARERYGARCKNALRPASWCCIPRRRRSSIARMRTAAATFRTSRSTFSGLRFWVLYHRSDKSLQDLASMYNPGIRGWINYYSHFYKTQLRP
jgi:hypothetical protein